MDSAQLFAVRYFDSRNRIESVNHGNRSIALPDAVEKAVLAAA
ncbi:MAG TPA: hypothetical protein VGD36_18480 [Xanthobacteraceae bacterium]|jgi:hypothetical protein